MNENILVVEHRTDLLDRFVDILRGRHYNPIATKSRSQAVNISNESTLDLILLDADIGDSQGLQLLDTFKNQDSTKGTPIILLSTPYRKMEFIEEALNLGIDGLIFIPFDEMELIVRVNSCLKYRTLYVEHQKLIKQADYLQNSLNDMTEVSNRNYQSYKEAQKKYDDILNIDLETGLWNKKEFYEFLKAFSPYKIEEEDIFGTAKGYWIEKEQKIIIKKSLSIDDKVSVLLHELTHAFYDDFDYKEDRNLSETFVESVAFIVADYFDLDTSLCSFEYIASWVGEDTKIILELGNKIQKCANSFIKKLEEFYNNGNLQIAI